MLLRRLFATTTGAIVSKGAAIITALVLFRQLPTADMGRYTAALTLVSFCAILGNAGLNPLTTREIARRGEEGWGWWAGIVPLRLLLALGAYGLLVGVALLVPRLVDSRLALVAGLLLVPDALVGALAATLGGMGKAALASWLDALSSLVGLLATLALVLVWHADVLVLVWLIVTLAAWAFILNGLALLRQWRGTRFNARNWAWPQRGWRVWLRRRAAFPGPSSATLTAPDVPDHPLGAPKILPIWAHEHAPETQASNGHTGEARPSRKSWQQRALTWKAVRRLPSRLYADWKYALAVALPLGFGALAATLYFRVDTLFLNAVRGGQAVAFYSAPYQIVEAFWLISSSWNAVMLPVLARRYSPRVIERSVAMLLGIGLPASLVIAFRADDIVAIVFGSAYRPAVLPLRLVIWVVPILFSYCPVVTALFVHDRQRDVLYVLLANLVLVLLLDAMLIPPYGVLGASVATLIVEAGGLIGYLFIAHRTNLGIIWLRGLVGPAFICLPLAAILLIGQALPFLFIMPAVFMLWCALFALFGPWEGGLINPQFFSSQEARGQAPHSGRRPEGPAGNGSAGGPDGASFQAPTDDTLAYTRLSAFQLAFQGMVIP